MIGLLDRVDPGKGDTQRVADRGHIGKAEGAVAIDLDLSAKFDDRDLGPLERPRRRCVGHAADHLAGKRRQRQRESGSAQQQAHAKACRDHGVPPKDD